MGGGQRTRVLIIGGGFVGLYTALGLERHLRGQEVEIVLVSPESFMLYQPFLPEVASGTIEPRHATVPLRSALRRTRLVTGMVVGLEHASRRATVQPPEGKSHEIVYDHVVIGAGSSPRVLPIPGLADCGLGFTSIGEATYLRNRVLSRLDLAESTTDATIRDRALTFCFIGAGYSGVEALAELEDLARDASKSYPTVTRADMRWVLVEATDRILPEVGDELSRYALERIRRRDIEVHLDSLLESAEGGVVKLSDGTRFEAETVVWTAGVKAEPLTQRTGFEIDDRGRIMVDEFLRVESAPGAWAAGDNAAVPTAEGGVHPPTAQHAMRQARTLARNVSATIAGEELTPFRYDTMGLLVSLGRYRGVAQVFRFRLRGFAAWLLHRSYHLLMIPTFRRKARVVADWTVSLFFARDVAQLDSLRDPKRAFERAFDDGEDQSK